jgi:hypothetical protein
MHFGSFEIDKDVVILVNGVRIGMRVAASALEIFATHETSVNIEIQRGY